MSDTTNQTPETTGAKPELVKSKRPVVYPRKRGRSTFIEGPAQIGNATAEELTWPIVKTGEIVRPPENV